MASSTFPSKQAMNDEQPAENQPILEGNIELASLIAIRCTSSRPSAIRLPEEVPPGKIESAIVGSRICRPEVLEPASLIAEVEHPVMNGSVAVDHSIGISQVVAEATNGDGGLRSLLAFFVIELPLTSPDDVMPLYGRRSAANRTDLRLDAVYVHERPKL